MRREAGFGIQLLRFAGKSAAKHQSLSTHSLHLCSWDFDHRVLLLDTPQALEASNPL